MHAWRHGYIHLITLYMISAFSNQLCVFVCVFVCVWLHIATTNNCHCGIDFGFGVFLKAAYLGVVLVRVIAEETGDGLGWIDSVSISSSVSVSEG
mmetsp:Transcript_14730/g.41000  ORF Transcript_14730/g.41000 Transcript_14730/m.41000 type:complete len:95 (+) Transcript_14730:2163-2447(+)